MLKMSLEVGRTDRAMKATQRRADHMDVRARAGRIKPLLVLSLVALMVFAVGCYNINSGETTIGGRISFKLPAFPQTGSHAVVIFSEMHYQPSYRVQEVPRRLPPEGSVPVTGRAVRYSDIDGYKSLSIPQGVSSERGRDLYVTNCVVCHGANADGNGKILEFLGGKGPVPPNLVTGNVASVSDGEAFAWVSFGGQAGFASALRGRESPSWMPTFGKLLSEQERWEVVSYLRSIQ